MSTIATVPQTEPSVAAAAPGRSFFWCKCGRSFARPFCDGTHSGGCCRHDDAEERQSAAGDRPA
jgi:CDGSH-type Zn-finger protein